MLDMFATRLRCPGRGCSFSPKLKDVPCPNCGNSGGEGVIGSLLGGGLKADSNYRPPAIKCDSCKTTFQYIVCPECNTKISGL